MKRDPVDESIENAKAKVKEATGKVLNEDELNTEGLIDQVSGKGQADYGDAKERAKDNFDKL